MITIESLKEFSDFNQTINFKNLGKIDCSEENFLKTFMNKNFESIDYIDIQMNLLMNNLAYHKCLSESIEKLKRFSSTEAYDFSRKYNLSFEDVENNSKSEMNVFKRIWEGIKKIFKKIIEIFKSFFRWIANLFRGDKTKKCEEATKDRAKVTALILKNPSGKTDSSGSNDNNNNKVTALILKNPSGKTDSSGSNDNNNNENIRIGTIKELSEKTIVMRGVDNKTWSKNPKKTVNFIKSYAQTANKEILDNVKKYESVISRVSMDYQGLVDAYNTRAFDDILNTHKTKWTVDKVLYGVDKAQIVRYTYLDVQRLVPDEILYRNVMEAVQMLAKKEETMSRVVENLLKHIEETTGLKEYLDKAEGYFSGLDNKKDNKNKDKFKLIVRMLQDAKNAVVANARFAIGLSREIDDIRTKTLKVYTELKRAVDKYL